MSDATSPIDPTIAARLAELEALVVVQQAALEAERTELEAERARRTDAEAERDRLRSAYEALAREVELARRRLVIAKAERIDTTQLELEFAAKLAALDELAGKVDDDEGSERPSPSATSARRSTGGAICACSTSLQLLGLDPRAHVAPVARILSELRSVRRRGSEAVSHRAMVGRVRAAQCVLERIVVLTCGVRDLRRRCPESGSCMCKEIHLSSGAYEPQPARAAGDLAPAIDEHQPDPHDGGTAPPVALHRDDRDLEPCELRRDRPARGAPHVGTRPTADLAALRRGDRRHLAVGHDAEW